MRDTMWLLWDGDCDYCRDWAEWIEQRDVRNEFTIISYQQASSPPMTPALVVQASRAVLVVNMSGLRLSGAAAVLFALETVGWHAGIMRLARRKPLLWVAEAVYGVVARNRGRFRCRVCES